MIIPRHALPLAALGLAATFAALPVNAALIIINDGDQSRLLSPLEIINEARLNERLRAEMAAKADADLQAQAALNAQLAMAKQESMALAAAEAKAKADLNALSQVQPGKVTVTFDHGNTKFVPQPDAEKRLSQFAPPARAIIIRGYTDNRGTSAQNAEIALARALVAKQWLMAHGMSETKITVYRRSGSYVATNATEEGRAANRRVEIEFVN